MAKKDSSRRWLKEHFTDPYVKKAQLSGYRSRAIFKLQELAERYHLFKSGMTVIDLGASPGGWSQYVAPIVKPNGRVIALDLLPMKPLPSVSFIQGDFTEDAVMQQLLQILDSEKADWVLSDMAPNMSGNESVDIPRSVYLAEIALAFALQVLKPQGGFLIKVFQGEGFDALLSDIKRHFKTVAVKKPKASRGRSREVYLLARELRVK